MGYRFEFDSGNNILRCSWKGRVTDQHLMEGFSAAVTLLALHPSSKVIDDYSGVTEIDVSSETIERLAKLRQVPPGGIDSVIVVIAPKDLVYGLARMFSMIHDQTFPNVHVVRTVRQAHALLGVTSTQFSPIIVQPEA